MSWGDMTMANDIDQEQLNLITIVRIVSILPSHYNHVTKDRVHLNAIIFRFSCLSSAAEQIFSFVLIVFCAGFFVEFKEFNDNKK